VLDFPTHDIFIGELVQTYVKDIFTTEGKIDIAKIRPLLFDMASMKYWGLGSSLGKCWNVGKSLKNRVDRL
jgi:flavin reductase (DIM6/NTAB) family NADH-FMN oxidoreductase RutF